MGNNPKLIWKTLLYNYILLYGSLCHVQLYPCVCVSVCVWLGDPECECKGRAPCRILAALGFIAQNITIEQMLQEGTEAFTTGTIIFMFITIPIIIWNIVLTYNAIKVSCDIKGKGLTGLVVIGLLVAETLTTALKLSLYKLPF